MVSIGSSLFLCLPERNRSVNIIQQVYKEAYKTSLFYLKFLFSSKKSKDVKITNKDFIPNASSTILKVHLQSLTCTKAEPEMWHQTLPTSTRLGSKLFYDNKVRRENGCVSEWDRNWEGLSQGWEACESTLWQQNTLGFGQCVPTLYQLWKDVIINRFRENKDLNRGKWCGFREVDKSG